MNQNSEFELTQPLHLTEELHVNETEQSQEQSMLPLENVSHDEMNEEERNRRVAEIKHDLLSHNPVFKAFMDKLLAESDPMNDSNEMKMVKAALYGISATEAEALRKMNVRLGGELQYMKNSLIEACNKYIATKNPWSSRGKERLNMIKALRGIAVGDAMSTPAITVKNQIAGTDVAAKVQQKPDAGLALLKEKFEECEEHRDVWTAPQKKIMSKVKDYLEKRNDPWITQLMLEDYVKDVMKAFKENSEQPEGPMLSALQGVKEAFDKIVSGAGENFVTEGAKHITYDEDAEGSLNLLRGEVARVNYITTWSDRRDAPLFTKDPEYNDIKQRLLGNCYMLATLGSIARAEPQKIRDMIKDNGDGTATVRLFKPVTDEINKKRRDELLINSAIAGEYSGAETERKMLTHLAKGYLLKDKLSTQAYNKWIIDKFPGSAEETRYTNDVSEYIRTKELEKAHKQQELTQYEQTHPESDRLDANMLPTDEYLSYQNAVQRVLRDLKSVRIGNGYAKKRKYEIFVEYMAAHQDEFSHIDRAKTRIEALGLAQNKVDLGTNPRFNYDALKEFADKLCRLGTDNAEIKKLSDAIAGGKYEENSAKFGEALGRMPEDDFQMILTECRTEIQKMGEPCPAFEPLFVTVNKTVPVINGYGDSHSRDALWVQLITKAYVVSGIHEQAYNATDDTFYDENIQSIYVKAKEKVISEESSKPESERLDKQQIRQKAKELCKMSYQWIAGGYSDVFAEFVTGEEHVKEQRKQSFYDKKALTEKNAGHYRNILKNSFDQVLNYQTENEAEEAKPAPELSASGMSMLCSVSGSVVANLEEKILTDKIEAVTTEDISEAYLEEVKKKYDEAIKLGVFGSYFPNYDKAHIDQFIEILEKRAQEYAGRIADFIETHINGTEQIINDLNAGSIFIGHRSFASKEDEFGDTVGVYSEVVNAEFEKMKDKLANGMPVEAGTHSFLSGTTALNGEPKSAGFVGGHAYSVVGVTESDGFKFVELFNPHHMTARNTIRSVDSHGNITYSYEATQDDTFAQGMGEVFGVQNTSRTGVFTMELNDFMNRVSHIYY